MISDVFFLSSNHLPYTHTEKRFWLEPQEPEAVQPSLSPVSDDDSDEAPSSAAQSGDDDNEDSDTSTLEDSGNIHTEGSSPSCMLLEKDPVSELKEPEPATNELKQCVKLIHCLPCSPPACKGLPCSVPGLPFSAPACKGLLPALDFSKWKPPESLLYRVITTTELPWRPLDDRGEVGGLCEPKGVGVATSRRSGSEGWHGRGEEEEGRDRGRGDGGGGSGGGGGGGGGGKDEGGDGERDDSSAATAASRDRDKPPDHNAALPSEATPPAIMLVTGGGKTQTPSAKKPYKKPYKYLAASASSVGGDFFIGGGGGSGGERGREERGGGRGGGKEAGGEGRGGKGGGGGGGGEGGREGGGVGGEGGRREGGGGEGNIDIQKSSGEVEAVKASSDDATSDGRGIITHDGKTDPKAQKDNDTVGDSPMKIQPASPTMKAPEPPPNLPPLDTPLLPFAGYAPLPDDPVPIGLDTPPNCETVYYEEGSHLFSMLVCPTFMGECNECPLPYWKEAVSTCHYTSVYVSHTSQ